MRIDPLLCKLYTCQSHRYLISKAAIEVKVLVPLFLSLYMVTGFAQERKYVTVKRAVKAMGTTFDITVVAPSEEIGYINIDEATAEIGRIEKIISSWDPESETSLINNNAGIKPVRVSRELFKLIERSIQISEMTDGAFDITFASIDQVWKFDGSMNYKPTDAEVKKSIAKVGYRNIVLDEDARTVFLKLKGMKISFGAIGKGYAAEKAKELLVSKRVVAGVINASGDLTTWGTKATGEKWLIGIAHPLNKGKIFTWLPVLESSVATSRNFDQYVNFKGKKYSHIIDPRTGYPTTGISSVHVFANSAEFCDALATAIFIMGKDAGLTLIDQLPLTEAILIDSQNKIHKSNGILLDD